MTERFSPMQRRVLTAMLKADVGFAAFDSEGSRKCGFGVFPAKHGGIIIRAYDTPEFFLKGRGMIERVEREVRGVWYQLTDKGRTCANRLTGR